MPTALRLVLLTCCTLAAVTLSTSTDDRSIVQADPPRPAGGSPWMFTPPINPAGPAGPEDAERRFRTEAEIDAWIDAALGEQEPADPLAAVEACIQAEMEQTQTPGASIAILRDGAVLLAKGYGVKAAGDTDPVDDETMFRIGSTTKMMVAAGLLQMAEQGKVDLNMSITTYIPELELDPPWDPETITIRHLLTHSAGVPDRLTGANFDSKPPIDPDELASWATTLGDWPLHAPPGSFWNYSNPSWSLAGLVLENASGEKYRPYLKDKVWEPAGMPLTTLEPDDVMEHGNYTFGHGVDPMTGEPAVWAPNDYDSGWAGPAGFAFSTPTEMVTWANLLMNGGGGVLSPASTEAMQSPQMFMDYLPWMYYGYGVFLDRYRGVETRDHGGNIPGWSSMLVWVPEHRFAVSVLANTITSLSGSAYCAVREVLALEPGQPQDFSTDPATWQKYAGTYDGVLYDGRTFPMWILWEDGQLEGHFEFPADVGGVVRAPVQQAFLDTFFVDIDGNDVPDLDFTFIDDPVNPGPIKWLRHRHFVGTRGEDRPVPTLAPTDVPTITPTPDGPTATPDGPTHTPLPTTPPKPVYLPVTIKDTPCTPVDNPIDVVFVIDGSAYMKSLHDGRQAWDIALDNVRTMLGQMRFGNADRAGVVVFRNRAAPDNAEIHPVTGDGAAVRRFVDGLTLGDPRDTCRIDVGLQVGRNLLRQVGPTGNTPVIVLVSELQAKNVPYEHFADCEERPNGNEECAVLKVADAIKADGITIALFATGTGNRGGQLLPEMVSDKSRLFFERPNADQILGMYRHLVPRVECPREMFWPYVP